jgi:pyruvate dehydrogenase complex dehydrogenase (E1) component
MAKLTVTMRALLARRNGADSIVCTGIRETNAARALVAAGMAARYESQAKMITGTYYNHFRRGYATRAPRADIGGILYFNAE